MKILEGKTALITGATHGIGRAIAIAYAAEGANVVACGRDEAALASLAAEIGPLCAVRRTDVQSEADIEAAVVAAVEMGEFGIRVNAIGPGAIDTRMTAWMKLPGIGEAIVSETPLGRVGQTDDLTGLAVYLASDASSFITGQVFYADGGASLMR